MYVNSSAVSPRYDNTGQSTNSPNVLGGSDTAQTFLTLLLTQLRTQDPLSPMDPKDMVAQLVQFNTLGEIMTIRQILEQDANTQAAAPAQHS